MTTDTILSILIRGAALLAVVGCAVLVLRRASAAHRHLAWALGAAAVLVLPALTLTLPGLDVAVLPQAPAPTPIDGDAKLGVAPEAPAEPSVPGAAPILAVTPARAPAAVAAPAIPLAGATIAADAPSAMRAPSLVAILWIAGASLVALRLAAALCGVRRVVQRSTTITDERVLAIARDAAATISGFRLPALHASSETDTPVTVGALRPRVILPLDALSWPADRLHLALLHEFAHVRRRDVLAEMVARSSLVVHWPNPLAWIAVSRLRVERERACDDLVLGAGHGAAEYADLLVSLARSLRRNPLLSAPTATMAGGAHFERRVRAVLDTACPRRGPSVRASAISALLTAVALAFAACVHPTATTGEPSPRAPDDPPSSAPAEKLGALGYVAPPAAPVLTVALDGSGQYATVSAALDAAPAGATVRIGPGTFDEHLLVTKTVTLEGAGADRTTIVSDVASAEDLQPVWAEYRRAYAAAASDAERKSVQAGFATRQIEAQRPSLRIRGARDVVVRGLTLTGRGKRPDGGAAQGGVLDVADAEARIENVAIVGGPGSGVLVREGAGAELRGCLVAGLWGTGVVVLDAGERTSRVLITACDIRNCWQRGITVAPGRHDVTIEGCRISGSSWHGIRYDSAAPVVRGNLIFANVRSGIYASGRTAGVVEENLFFENGMSDVSCWFEAKDRIERNTFVRSKRESVAILGTSAPIVRRNVFAECATVILAGDIDGNSTPAASTGGATIEGNFVWKAGAEVRTSRVGGGGNIDGPLPAGNVTADPQFADAAKLDFSLRATSPARAAGAGAAAPLTFVSPWATRPEEAATAPHELPAAAPKAPVAPAAPGDAAKAALDAVARAKEDILQRSDAARRERGLVALGAAMLSDHLPVARTALGSLQQLKDVPYDKSRFRPQVRAQIAHADPEVQRAASYAVLQLDRDPGDLDLVLTLLEAEPVPSGYRMWAALALDGDRADGRLAKLFVKALAVDDPVQGAMDTANFLRGKWVAPDVDDAVVAAWRRHPIGRNGSGMWPFIFGQMTSPAREARVRAIFELLASGDEGMRQLAGVALTRPVDGAARPVAAKLAADAIAAAKTDRFRRTYIDVMRVNGSREQVPVLRALAADATVAEELRTLAKQAADEFDAPR